jgi:hypothetical protein
VDAKHVRYGFGIGHAKEAFQHKQQRPPSECRCRSTATRRSAGCDLTRQRPRALSAPVNLLLKGRNPSGYEIDGNR